MEKDCCACEYTYSEVNCIDDCLEMTIEEAIEILKYYRPIGAINAGFPEEPGEDVKAFNLAIELLEKQIGFHVSNISKDKGAWKNGYCKCGYYAIDSDNYCNKCGQKLNWTDKE